MSRKMIFLLLTAVSFSGIASLALADDSRWQRPDDPIARIIRNRQKCPNAICTQTKTAESTGIPKRIAASRVTAEKVTVDAGTQVLAVSVAPHEALKVPGTIFVPAPVEKNLVAAESENGKANWWDKNTYLDANWYAGFWKTPRAGTMGVWSQAEAYNMFRWNDKNVGIGVIGKFDRGWSKSNFFWGDYAVGPRATFQSPVGDNGYFQIKGGPEYRFNMGGKQDAWGMSGRIEYDHVITSKDRVILSADGTSFYKDSYLGMGLYWDHWWTKWLRSKIGITSGINFGADMTSVGVGPWAGVTLWNDFDLGCGAQLSPFGLTYGCLAGYNFNNGMRKFDAYVRKKGVVSKQPSEKNVAAVPGEVTLVETSNGTYSAAPGTENITISTKTLDDVQ